MNQNEQAYQHFVAIAKRAKARGMKRYSARAVLHILRWETWTADADKQFKINDHKSPEWARRAMSEYPELSGFFSVREAA